ncbi:MAG: GNAT family N-acetyltransferase [Clostridia bacterium]|nr:GNAT family N-acetyltransferase [Clostridia bacterium]
MDIVRVEKEKKRFLDLLLLADEQEDMIDLYLERGEMFAGLEGARAVCVCVVTDEGDGVLEIKNLAVAPDRQGRGYGRAMIGFVVRTYGGRFAVLRVGTGESPLTLPFYEKCGFRTTGRIKDFFTDHYDHPIVEGGVQLRDMVILERSMA